MIKQTYVLDTSAIVTDPRCLEKFPKANIVIHIKVLQELDKLKSNPSEGGKNTRVFIRRLDKISEEGNLVNGIEKYDSIIKVNTDVYEDNQFGSDSYGDNVILECANRLNTQGQVTLVTNDITMRILAKAFNIKTIGNTKDSSLISEMYLGIRDIQDPELGEELKKTKTLPKNRLNGYSHLVKPNECISFKDEKNKCVSLGRIKEKNLKFINGNRPWGLESKNTEQACAIDTMLDPDISLVSLSGISGTGKTLLAIACGLESVIQKNQYDQLIIYRPIQPVGMDIGYLPGDLFEKLDPWMSAIKDSIEFLINHNSKTKKRNGQRDNWKEKLGQFSDYVSLEALTYIRGRSISNAYIILDEAQNTSTADIKTVFTRMGHGSKIILTGDLDQIDSSGLDAMNNGLFYAVEKFKDSELAAHITLTKGERSPLASLAAQIL